MKERACPVCKCTSFYVKNPRDAFEVFEFRVEEGRVFFDPEEDGEEVPALGVETETYCTRCSWHDRFAALQGPGEPAGPPSPGPGAQEEETVFQSREEDGS